VLVGFVALPVEPAQVIADVGVVVKPALSAGFVKPDVVRYKDVIVVWDLLDAWASSFP
jgi:hypothetical protein